MTSEYIEPQQLTPGGPTHGGFTFHAPGAVKIEEPAPFPVCTISGSMRNFSHMLKAADKLSADGWIVLMPFVTFVAQDQDSPVKQMLDQMHFAKIDLSERVYVVSGVNEYYGDSTRREIAYARDNGKPVTFLKADPIIGGEFVEWEGEQ